MHTDVELNDSPSRQRVLEEEVSRQTAIKIFPTKSCTPQLSLLMICAVHTYKDEPVPFPIVASSSKLAHNRRLLQD
jgi:hypothetical protein